MVRKFINWCVLIEKAFEISQRIITRAVQEEKSENEQDKNNPAHLSVSGDGTWKKRGFSSTLCISNLIGSFCQACDLWNRKKNDSTQEYR